MVAVKAFARYLLGALIFAGGFYLIRRFIWPDEHSMGATFPGALTFGLLVGAPRLLKDLLGLKENDPFPPLVSFVFSVGWLSVTAVVWSRIQALSPLMFRVGVVCLFVGMSLFHLTQGIRRMRQGVPLGGEVRS